MTSNQEIELENPCERSLPTTHGYLKLMTRGIDTMPHKMFVHCGEHEDVSEGAVLIHNREQGLFAIYNDGLFPSLRSLTRHIPNNYEDEGGQLAYTDDSLMHALSLSWDLKDHKEDIESYSTVLQEAFTTLQHVRNEHKVEARSAVAGSVEPYDSRGRFNPSSRSAKLVKARDRVGKRRREAHWINGHMRHRGQILVHWLNDFIWPVRNDVMEEIGRLSRQFKRRDGNISASQLRNASKRFDGLIRRLRLVYVAPFGPGSFKRSAKDLRQAVWHMREGRLDEETRRLLGRTWFAMHLLGTHKKLEELLFVISTRKHSGAPMSAEDATFYRHKIEWLTATLEGSHFDADFEAPIIARVLDALRETREHIADDNFDVEEVCALLKQAIRHF